MVVVPAAIPPSTPPPMLIVPTAVLLLLQVPPAGAPVSVIVDPSHTCIDDGEIPVGNGFISIGVVREQPETV